MRIFAEESIVEARDELSPLLKQNFEEVELHQDRIFYDPDWDTYIKLEDLGMVKLYTARDNGLLIGYYIVIINPSTHCRGDLFGIADVVYIKKEYRQGKTVIGLFKYVEKEMRGLGVSLMIVHMKPFLPFDKLCLKLGWEYTEKVYSKCLKEAPINSFGGF